MRRADTGARGGSLEDLWAFIEERVARAIHRCPIPVVSGVGHEVDDTIADLVADVRAPTPSAAAERVVPDHAEWLRLLQRAADRLARNVRVELQSRGSGLQHLARRLDQRHPGRMLHQQGQRLDELESRLSGAAQRGLQGRVHRLATALAHLRRLSPAARIERLAERLLGRASAMEKEIRARVQRDRARLDRAAAKLDALSPLKTLERGYAIATTAAGELLRRSTQVAPGDLVTTRLAKGGFSAEVKTVKKE